MIAVAPIFEKLDSYIVSKLIWSEMHLYHSCCSLFIGYHE